ncbi:MAG TPA: hypothetical protein RMH80_19135, partial [Polyangiaceae bacterium LLY-WYZ-15_(1-7)]|nr:hypothetical protein [Polyangiaceae bacterium LLY-WYZ-15_(1-7)]
MQRRLTPALFALVATTACVPRAPATVARVVGGERRAGAFVSPYAYEHFVRAELAAAEGRWEEAIAEYEQARLGPSDDAYVVARMALALEAAGRAAEADRALEAGLALDPESEAVFLARGRILAGRGEREAAIEATARAAELAPDSDGPVLQLAELLRAGGADARALALLERAEASPHALRARLTLALERRDAEASGEAVEALLRVAPLRIAEVEQAAALALEEERPALALRLLAHLPEEAAAGLRVDALLAAGRADEAEALLLTRPPEAFGGPVEQAERLRRAGRPSLAIELAEAGAALELPGAWLALGQARLAAGDAPAAAAAFARVPEGTADARAAR